MILFLVLGCGIKVNYVVKNTAIPSVAKRIKTSKFGVIIIGDAISGLYDIIKADVAQYQGNQSDIKEIKIGDSQLAKLKTEGFRNLTWDNYEVGFLFIINQKKPKIEKNCDRYGSYKSKKEVRVYSTTIKIKCNIFLYDIENQSIIARSNEDFSFTEVREYRDMFSTKYIHFDIAELIFNPTNSDEKRYPEVNYLDAKIISNYFFSFLKGIEK
jgi:hypothetical protein